MPNSLFRLLRKLITKVSTNGAEHEVMVARCVCHRRLNFSDEDYTIVR